MIKSAQVRLPAGKMVKKSGDVESDIYFIVSGALNENTNLPLEEGGKVQGISTVDLIANDFFGDIYPFEEEKVSQSDVETITTVELAKISKPDMMELCRNYPNIEHLLNQLYQARSRSDKKEAFAKVRRAARHQLPTRVSMKIFHEKEDKSPLVVEGFADDVSLSGACVVLGERYWMGPSNDLVGKNVKLQIILANTAVTLNIWIFSNLVGESLIDF